MKAIKIGFAALMLLTIGTACHSNTSSNSGSTDTVAAPSPAMPDSSGNNATTGGSGTGTTGATGTTDSIGADTNMRR